MCISWIIKVFESLSSLNFAFFPEEIFMLSLRTLAINNNCVTVGLKLGDLCSRDSSLVSAR